MRNSLLLVAVASLIVLIPQGKPVVTADTLNVTRQDYEILKPHEALQASEVAELASVQVEPPKAVVAAPVALPGNAAKAFIYQHESGNNPSAVNPGGCRGLGQACPGSKLPCGADYACQDAWFTSYMERTYGTWEHAQAVWQSRCGSPQGCWW